MKPRENFDGVVFNSLTVVHDIPSERGERKVMCQCKCGVRKPVTLAKLKTGHTKSCGKCIYSPLYKHGMTGTKFYLAWENMVGRCRDTRNKNYGGRGIRVCDSWLSFQNFMDDMYESYDESLTLERKDVDGNYCPENCEWVTMTVQGHNRRKYRGNCVSYGVHWNERDSRFIVAIVKDGVRCRIYYTTEEDAAKSYDDASEILYGDRPNKTEPREDLVKEKTISYLRKKNLINP
jgi:hypothetical protein